MSDEGVHEKPPEAALQTSIVLRHDVYETPSITYVHPFDRPPIQAVIDKYIPQYALRLQAAARPSIPLTSDEIDRQEAAKVQQTRTAFDGTQTALPSTMYTELFAVNPSPTLGGILSHFYQTVGYKELMTPEVTVTPANLIAQLKDAVPIITPDLKNFLNNLLECDLKDITILALLKSIKRLGTPTNTVTFSSGGRLDGAAY